MNKMKYKQLEKKIKKNHQKHLNHQNLLLKKIIKKIIKKSEISFT